MVMKWRQGKYPDTVVTDEPSDIGRGHADTDYYGGYLVCESVEPKHRALIIAAPQLLEALEAVEWGRGGCCPYCGWEPAHGHGQGCYVAEALAAARGEQQ